MAEQKKKVKMTEEDNYEELSKNPQLFLKILDTYNLYEVEFLQLLEVWDAMSEEEKHEVCANAFINKRLSLTCVFPPNSLND